MLQLRSEESGGGKVSVTPVAVPEALVMVVVMVKMVGLQEMTLAASGVLVTCRLGWFTVSEPVPVVGGVFVPCAVAVLVNVPDVPAVVGLTTCTLTLAPGARSPNAQVSVCCAGAVPAMEHVPGPV